MLQQLILCFIGFCAGIIVAGGVSGLLIGLSIVPRYAGITHTADCIFYMKTVHFWEPLPELSSPSFRSGSRWGLFSWLSVESFSESFWAAGFWHWRKSQKSFPSLPGG